MELEYLKEFLVMAKRRDMAEAADELYVSHSAVSRHMRRLEEDMGVELFDRTSRTMQLNAYGEIFQKYAQELLAVEHRCKRELLAELEKRGNVLRLAALFGIAYYKICHIFNLFQQRHPECQLFIYEADTKENFLRLYRKECDFAFVLSKTLDVGADYEGYVVSEDRLAAVVSKEHPLAKASGLTPQMLEGEPLILPDENSGMYDYCRDYFQGSSVSPEVKVTTLHTENMINLSEKGMGIALVMEKEAKEYLTGNVVLVPLKPEVSVNVLLVCDKETEKKEFGRKFINCLREVMTE